jgi:hypothetical protein
MKAVQIKVGCYQWYLEDPVIMVHSPQRRRGRSGSAED